MRALRGPPPLRCDAGRDPDLRVRDDQVHAPGLCVQEAGDTPGQDGVDRIFGAGDRFGDRGARNRQLRQFRAREVQRAIRPGADDYLVTAHGEGQLGARLKNVGIGPLGPLRWPGVISLFAKAHVFDRAVQVQDFLGQRPHGVLDRLARANRCTVSTTATLSPRRSLSSREVVSYFDDAVLTTMWPASM